MNMTMRQFTTRLSTINYEATHVDPVDLADVVILIDGELCHIDNVFVVMNRMNDETATCVITTSDETLIPDDDDDTMANIMYHIRNETNGDHNV